MEINNIYYVYVYLNPLKTGEYIYDGYKFECEPFYIGFGKGKRYKDHLYRYKSTGKSHKNNIIKKIITNGKEPIILKLKENMSSIDGIEFEISMIGLIGRHDLNEGSLTNRTDGGDSSGYRHSEESLEKMILYQQSNHPFKGIKRPKHSEFMKENNPMFNDNVRLSHLDACNKDDFIENCRKNSIGEKNPFYGKKHTEKTKKILRDKQSLKVEQIDIETLKILNVYDSIKLALEPLNGITSGISECCRGKFLSSGGFYWEYNDVDLKKKYKNKVNTKRKNTRRIKKISQFDKDGNLLNIFDNAAQASKKTDTNQCNILKCCKGKQLYSNGFIWKYFGVI